MLRSDSKLDEHADFIHERHRQGISAEKIAEELKATGKVRSVSRGTIHQWLKTHPEPPEPPVSPPPSNRKGRTPGTLKQSAAPRTMPAPPPDTQEEEPPMEPPHQATGPTASPHTAHLDARLDALEEQNAALQAELARLKEQAAEEPAAVAPELSWREPPLVPQYVPPLASVRWPRIGIGYALLFVVLGIVLYRLYEFVAAHPVVTSTVAFLHAPSRSLDKLYAYATSSPVAVIEIGVALAGLALGFRARTLLLASLIWLMHISIEKGYFLAFAVLLLFTGRVMAAMLRRAARL
jgi:hypothetical protein